MKLFTYIVNMAMDTHKRKFMEAQLQGIQNLDIHWLNAINGKKLTDHQIEESVDLNLFKSRIGREFTLPEIGCTLSHKKFIKTCASEGSQLQKTGQCGRAKAEAMFDPIVQANAYINTIAFTISKQKKYSISIKKRIANHVPSQLVYRLSDLKMELLK